MTRERDRIQENANKYIVKNCKSNYKLGSKYICGAPRIHHYLCQDCTDCLIKQVIEKCKKIAKDYYWGMREIRFSQEFLQLFDIEEINK